MKDKKQMSSWRVISVTFMILIVSGVLLTGCKSAQANAMISRILWSEYPPVPGKDYTVVGVVTVRDANPNTLSTDLMERAAAIGAHDIINVRVDVEREGRARGSVVVAASAVAIKYTEETLSPELHEAIMPKAGTPRRSGLFGDR